MDWRDDLSYGTFAMDFPVPEGFSGVYPIKCGCQTAQKSPASVSGEHGSLFLYLLSGEGEAEASGKKSGYLADCVLTVPDAAELLLYPLEHTRYIYLLLGNAVDLLGQIGFLRPLESGERVGRLLARLCREGSVKDIYHASAQVYALLMETMASCVEERKEYSPLVREATALIREKFALLTGVEELAEWLGVSKNHLIRLFTAETGASPGKFLQSVKLEHAKLLLQNRDYSIETIADMVGYSSANYFGKVFRRAAGESPGEYRVRCLSPAALDLESQRRLQNLESLYQV